MQLEVSCTWTKYSSVAENFWLLWQMLRLATYSRNYFAKYKLSSLGKKGYGSPKVEFWISCFAKFSKGTHGAHKIYQGYLLWPIKLAKSVCPHKKNQAAPSFSVKYAV